MKVILFMLALTAKALTPPTLYVSTGSERALALIIVGSADGSATAPLVYGGLATAPDPKWSGKVVLADRGQNSFLAKVQAAESAGAKALVVANNVTGPVVQFSFGTSSSKIPSVSVSMSDGADLRKLEGTIVRVGPALEMPDPTGNTGKWIRSDGNAFVWDNPPASIPGISLVFAAKVGEPISLGVSSAGTGPFTFQWIKDGNVLAGKTSAVLDIPKAAAADAGTYVCQVTSPQGTAPSGAGVISVK